MEVVENGRGFPMLIHPSYPKGRQQALVIQSSIVGDYEDAMERPGTSALFVGPDHHLSREEVGQLVTHLRAWLEHGDLRGAEAAAMGAPS